MKVRRGRPSLEDELEETARYYFEIAEALRAAQKEDDEAYNHWQDCRERVRETEESYQRILRALLELRVRVDAKRAKEIAKLPANVIPIGQKGG